LLDPALLEVKGAHAETRFIPLATIKFIAGLQTQRSPFASIDTRYNSRYLGGKPDALIAGSNVEVSNSLTLQRRPGSLPLGPSIPAPLAFFEYKPSSPPNSQLIVDTATAIYNYSSTAAGILITKSPSAGQTNFMTVVNTLYMGNGVDLYKYVGPNLLTQSNTFINPVWVQFNVASLTSGQFDPLGGLNASLITWAATSGYVQQTVTPNYTPVVANTFTASVWLRANSGSPTITLFLEDQAGSNVSSNVITLSQTWTRYQVTGTLGASSTAAVLKVGAPSTTVISIQIYGAQLEVGGPATPTQITTTQPQGIYLWGIVGPPSAPSISSVAVGPYWQATHTYNNGDTITDSNGNQQAVTAGGGGMSGGSVPTWAITVGSTTTDGALTWTLIGPNGLTPHQGYQWYYAFLNQYTGQPSNVSPISASSSTLANNLGVAYHLSGLGSLDPQVNQIAIYRNVDGGPFFFQVGVVPNPANGGAWSFTDSVQDANLSSIYAPIGLLNTPPPAGAINPVWYQSRAWVSVGANLYFSSSTDNAAVLNIVLNAVIPESFAPANVLPLDQLIVRSLPTSSGLLVITIGDHWVVTGSDLASFNPVKALVGHGIRNFNAADSDGSTIWEYTSDRQFLSLNASAGSIEVGYAIGDVLQMNVDPLKAYVVRHTGGSLDNAVFLADGATGWYRMNPNQVGASVSGEPTAVWSPFATIVGGVQAIGSIETSPGVHQFLLGAPGSGAVLSIGQLAQTGANSGSGTPWTNPGNVTLNNPATPATVTLNSVSTPSGSDVAAQAFSSGTAVASGSVTTNFNNELAIAAIYGENYNVGAPTLTAGAGWTIDSQNHFGPDNSFFYNFGVESMSVASSGTGVNGQATMATSGSWGVTLATFFANTGVAPTVVQKSHAYNSSFGFGTLSVNTTPASAITQGNFLVVAVGAAADVGNFVVFDSLGNAFTKVIGSSNRTAIYIAPITTGGTDTITFQCGNSPTFIGVVVYELTLPSTSASASSQFLQATNFNLNVPNNNILGVKVFVVGNQTSSAPDATVTLSWISPSGPSPIYTFQLPSSSGIISFGGSNNTWGQALMAALLNGSSFGFQLQASVVVTPNVTFDVSAVFVQVFYLGGSVVTSPILVRDLNTFTDNGSAYTWSATLGSLVLGFSGTLAEVESVSTFLRNSSATQPTVAVLLDEISGAFETLPSSVNDSPQLVVSSSVLGKRFYLSQGATPPLCQHLQIQLSGGANATKDELLALVVRGAIVPEQEGA
jgi:hypothetical protein